jgi:ABC-2 type transport system ATP-binding protein
VTALLELSGLTKRYGTITALNNVDAVVEGKIIGLLGPNGAGKSTLLKCLLGLIPYQGHAKVLGLSAATHGAEIRDRVGYMPEQESFISGMNAVEQCTYAGELSGLPRNEAMQRAHAALYYAGVEEKRYQPIDGYSTGLKQRVKLAQALVHDPELLFLDEPTNGLDPRSREDMLELISELPARRDCAIVLSTHLLPDVERVCDRALIMHRGRVRFSGTIPELRSGIPGPELRSGIPGPELRSGIPGPELRSGIPGTDLRDKGGHDRQLVIEVKEDAARFAEVLATVGAASKQTSPVALEVDLPEGATTRLVFETARDAGIQVRGLAARRESIEAAFLRVIGRPGSAIPDGSEAQDPL